MADVFDILDVGGRAATAPSDVTRERVMSKRTRGTPRGPTRRPEGFSRELYNLLCGDGKSPAPLLPTDTAHEQGYKQNKARLGMRKVRAWKWTGFTNPARSDGLVLYHWRHTTDDQTDYPFAKFNKRIEVPHFSDMEYQQHLQVDSWSKAETEHLMDLCSRFDLRFVVIHDRWDHGTFSRRSIEDLKERFYGICNSLAKVREGSVSDQLKDYVFDAAHEKKRKLQLKRLYDRSPEQVEEEQQLMAELRKIEARKRERERKAQDLQKLINSSESEQQRKVHKNTKKRQTAMKNLKERSAAGSQAASETISSAKLTEARSSGVSLRSQRLKIPASVGQKKIKVLEQLTVELGLETNPMPTENIASDLTNLRNDMLLLYDLKVALSSCEFDLQSLKHQLEAVAPDKMVEIPTSILSSNEGDAGRPRSITEVLDIHGSQGTPTRKRKAALEQSKVLTKVKART